MHRRIDKGKPSLGFLYQLSHISELSHPHRRKISITSFVVEGDKEMNGLSIVVVVLVKVLSYRYNPIGAFSSITPSHLFSPPPPSFSLSIFVSPSTGSKFGVLYPTYTQPFSFRRELYHCALLKVTNGRSWSCIVVVVVVIVVRVLLYIIDSGVLLVSSHPISAPSHSLTYFHIHLSPFPTVLIFTSTVRCPLPGMDGSAVSKLT